jgi:hypothetical protein
MASILVPPASTPPHNSPAPVGNAPDSQISPPERDNEMDVEAPLEGDNAMQVEAIARGGAPQPPPESTNSAGNDHMQVDEHGTNETIPTEPALRRTPRDIKPVNRTSNMQQLLPVPPSHKSKGKQQNKMSSIVKLQPRPVVIGSKHMQLNFIDLTQVEVDRISLLCFGAFHS